MSDPQQPATPPPATPPAYGQPAYGQPVYGQPVPARPTNGLAIAALICGFLVPVVGIILGHIALGQIKRTGEGGHGLALAGTIVGYVLTALYLIFIIFYFVVFAAVVGSATYY